jgi:hypothetical protein
MRQRKHHLRRVQYAAVSVAAGALLAFLFLHHQQRDSVKPEGLLAPAAEKPQTGYKPGDRAKLERLIHEGAKDD